MGIVYIGIDLGTTGCKAVLYSPDGKCISEYNREYSLIKTGSFVEQRAEEWYDLICDGIRYITADAGVYKINGISVSTQGISVVPVDRSFKALSNAVSWLDTRAVTENSMLEDRFSASDIYLKTGKLASSCYTLPKLMWIKKNQPELFFNTYKFLLPLDYINARLTGRAICDYTIASGTMAYDITRKKWSEEYLEFAGIPMEKLPEVGCMGDVVGEILPSVADELGIERGCAVMLGGQDQKLAAVGAGITRDSVTASFGTATAVTKLVQKPGDISGISKFAFNDEYYSAEGVVSTSGAALKWLSETFLGDVNYKALDILCEEAGSSGNIEFSPDFSLGASISGLTLGSSRGQVIYALYEGVCREIAAFADKFGSFDEIIVFGGGSKSDIWMRILANETKRTVKILDTPETASRGAAMLASGMKLKPAPILREIKPMK